MKNLFTLKYLLLLFVLGFGSLKGWAQQIYLNQFTGTGACPTQGNVPTVAINAAGSQVTRSTITCTSTNDVFNSTTLNSTASINNNSYIEFSATANVGAQLNLTSLSFLRRGSNTAPNQLEVRYSTDGFLTSTTWGAAPLTTTMLATATWDFPDFSTNIGGTVTFRIYVYGTTGCDGIVGGASSLGNFRLDDVTINGTVTTTPQYYRSHQSGDWNTSSTWEASSDNITWTYPQPLVPSSSDYTIRIQPGHTVTTSSSISLDETVIAGTLQVNTGGVLNINDGAGSDIDIQNGGVLQVLSTNTYLSTIIPIGSAAIDVETGGKITIGNGAAVGTGYEKLATSNLNTWNDTSVFEWNALSTFTLTNLTYFPNALATIPIFRISNVTGTPTSGGMGVTINGILEVNADVTLRGGSNKIFRNGIRGIATLTENNTVGNSFTLTAANSILDGSSLKIVLTSPLNLASSTQVPPGANVTISGSTIDNNTNSGTLTINGTLDITTSQITNTNGTVTVTNTGTLKTANLSGLYNTPANSCPSCAIYKGIVNFNSGVPGSTIEYNDNTNSNQFVSGATVPDYYNVTFSGSGTKTLVSNNNPAGTITVSGSAIFDAGNNTFGTAGTNLTMTETSTYINGGAATKPDAQGTYNLGINTAIEFDLNHATTIRLGSPISYANIVVSGNNVSNASKVTGILFQAGGSFKVKAGAIFKLKNTDGFSGNTTTAIDNSNNPSIILEAGSTIEYSGNGASPDQTITNQASLPYKNLTIAGTGNKTAPAGILTIDGDFTKSGTSSFVHNNGTVLFDGGATAQSYSSNTEVLFNNLTDNNLNTVTGLSVNNDMAIAGQLTLNNNSKFTLASGNVTLKSTSVATANVAAIPASASIAYGSGLFVVERYIPALRAWRFLSVPVNSSQTIHAAWQEGQLPNSTMPVGFGTQITSNRPTWAVDSFDVYSAGGPSMKTYNPATDSYVGIASTHIPFDPSLGGYMTFIRGDRTVNTFPGTPTVTVLRIKGQLFTGTQSAVIVPADEFMPVNNPYASRLQLSKLNKSQQFFFYVWDPKLGGATSAYGLGAFQTLSWNATNNNYDVVPGSSGSYGATTDYIESGQAFFAYYLTGGNLTVQENAKAGGSSLVFTPNQFPIPNPGLRTNLYKVNSDGSTQLADGILNSFSDSYSNDIDGMDAAKMVNTAENLSVKIGDKLLTIDRRHTVTQDDTIFLNLSGLQMQDYRFEITGTDLNLNNNTLTGFLEDNYLHTKTALNLSGATVINFTVNSSEGSAASNRFRIVLNAPDAGPLPVTVTNVKAYLKNATIAVEWNVENEKGIKQYEIEKSADADNFTQAGIVAAKNIASGNYSWADLHPVQGYNYYRIRIIDLDGKVTYTHVVKVFIDKLKSAITIYPNPIINGIINLQFINQPAGEYHIRMLNKMGQVLISKQINHSEGSSAEIIKCNYNLAHGIYQLEITQPDGNKKTIEVMN